MPRWGLVIGSGFDDPRGVENDTRLIGDALAARGFAVETLIGPRATREQILAGCDAILGAARPGDAVAIYFSGHGALVMDPPCADEPAGPRSVRVLCPSDHGASSDGDFRGIALVELSRRLRALGARTGNVTAILDCSHVAPLCRGAGASGRRARAIEHVNRLAISRHLQSICKDEALASAHAMHASDGDGDGVAGPHAMREARREGDGVAARATADVVLIRAASGCGGAFPVRLPATPRWLARGRGR